MYDLKDIMHGAWNVARRLAGTSGRPVRAHLGEALKFAWGAARAHASNPQAPAIETLSGAVHRVYVKGIPASLVAQFVAAGGQGVTVVGARSVQVEGRAAVQAVGRLVLRAHEIRRAALAAGHAAPVQHVSRAQLRREAAAVAAPTASVATTSGYKARLLRPASATASPTIERDGQTLSLTGYGRTWRIESEDCCVHGLAPDVERVRYAYYA